MKRIWTILLLVILMASCFIPVSAQEEDEDEMDEVLRVALYERPELDEPVHLTVGNTTKVSGGFFTRFFGNNTSDIDVRTMIYGYTPTTWDNQLEFVMDDNVLVSLDKTTDGNNVTYTFQLQPDLVYNDGVTPIRAQDYVFGWALSACPEFQAIGGEAPEVYVLGYDEYHSGQSKTYAGIRMYNDYRFSVTIKRDFDPYFYELHQLEMFPYPMSVIAPGCVIRDDGNGVYITGENGDPSAFSAFLFLIHFFYILLKLNNKYFLPNLL